MSRTRGSRHRGKGGVFGVPPGRSRGEETPSEPESSGDGNEEEAEDKEEGEITPSLTSSPPEDLLSLGDIFSQEAGISVGVRWMKCPRAGTGASSNPPP
jgi:hypothetical protein